MKTIIKCPVCNQALQKKEKFYTCGLHTFDISKEGYVNLLLNAKETAGDSKDMMQSRKDFLNLGLYDPLAEHVYQSISEMYSDSVNVLDVGCGEGYYLDRMYQYDELRQLQLYGLDISKIGIKMAAKRNKHIQWITGNSAALPFMPSSMDVVLSVFAIYTPKELIRIMRDDGIACIVRAGEDHLIELRQVIYPEIIEKQKSAIYDPDLFECIVQKKLSYKRTVQQSIHLQNLLTMTPHYWKIKKENKELLSHMDALEITFDFQIIILRKSSNNQ